MEPIIASFWGIVIPSWHVLVAFSAITSFLVLRIFLRWRALEHVAPLLFCLTYFAGYFGARAGGILTEERVDHFGDWISSLISMGPMNFYGGAVVGAVCAILFLKLKRLPIREMWDIGIVVLMLGLGIGRIGCHFNGCDFGIPVGEPGEKVWWAFVFPVLQDNVPRAPVQLEESFFSIVLFLFGAYFLKLVYKTRKAHWPVGIIGSIILIISAAHRFLNENWRGDSRGMFFHSTLSTAQGIALFLIGIGICIGGFPAIGPNMRMIGRLS